MANNLFRQKSVQQLESPESLDEYLKVTSPGVWILVASLILFLVGVCIWGTFGTIEATQTVAVVSQGDEVVCLVQKDNLKKVMEDKVVTIDNKDYTLDPESMTPIQITDSTNVYILMAGDLSSGDIVYQIPVKESLEEGIYTGSIVTEQITPISFLLN